MQTQQDKRGPVYRCLGPSAIKVGSPTSVIPRTGQLLHGQTDCCRKTTSRPVIGAFLPSSLVALTSTTTRPTAEDQSAVRGERQAGQRKKEEPPAQGPLSRRPHNV